jgi:16S rRNA (guanine527-N7)-methyltransferase
MEQLKKYFNELSEDQLGKFEQLQSLYEDWNAKINVISRKDLDSFYEHHVLHSLAIAKVIRFNSGAKILDVGTGGGFPGIPLAILFPQCSFTLVDSIGKKIKVVEEVSQALGLQNVKAINTRAELIPDKFDFVVSRAVTRMAPFYAWVQNKFLTKSRHELPNGILYLKGGDLLDELDEAGRPYKVYPITRFFNEPFFETKAVVFVEA